MRFASAQSAASPSMHTAEGAWSMRDAIALALSRNRNVIAAKLQVADSKVDEAAARLWQNPELQYNIANLILGQGNDQGLALRPSFFEQRQQSIGLAQTFDIWGKRTKRLALARQNTETVMYALEDMLRELVYQVRSAFADVVREQAESGLLEETQAGYAQTVALMRRREAAGDIARTDLDKVELESMRYQQQQLQAGLQLQQARAALAQLLAMGDSDSLPKVLQAPHLPASAEMLADADALVAQALQQRPDVRAAQSGRMMQLLAVQSAKREALPDVQVGVNYNRSNFVIGGDNAHTLGISVGLPLPLFDRNQAGLGHARVAQTQADNAVVQLQLEVAQQVRLALARWRSVGQSVRLFEEGGMLSRAERAKDIAKRSFAAGATSLLDLLEAERTRLSTQADYLVMLDAWRQAHIGLSYATAVLSPQGDF